MPPDQALYERIGERPKLNGWTLRFSDTELERQYQDDYRAAILGLNRFGILLTISLYLLFAVADLWLMPSRVHVTWPLRGGMALFLSLVLASTWTRAFTRHQQQVMLVATLAVAANIAVLYAVTHGEGEEPHFVSMFLLIVGSYSVLALQFHYTVMAGLAMTACYVLVDILFKDFPPVTTLLNLTFLTTTVVLVGAGARNGDRQRRVAFHRRLQVEREREESRQVALHDALTGLANRRLLLERLLQAVARNQRFQTLTAILFMDLDDFKQVNDTHGHAAGDLLLKEVARRLLEATRATDTVARLGGDEFVVLLEDLRDKSDIEQSLQRIRDAFATAAVIENVRTPIRVSIGMAVHPLDGDDARALLDLADQHMYDVKRERKRLTH